MPTCCAKGSIKRFSHLITGAGKEVIDGYLCMDQPLGAQCSKTEQCAGAGVGCINGKCTPTCNTAPFNVSWPSCDVNNLNPVTDPLKAIPQCGTNAAGSSYCCFAPRQKANASQNCPPGYDNVDFCTQETKVWEKDWVHRKCLRRV
jgi:hypothetical protein